MITRRGILASGAVLVVAAAADRLFWDEVSHQVSAPELEDDIDYGETLNKDVFQNMLERVSSASPLPIVFEIGATWCGPCKYLRPLLDKAAAENGLPLLRTNILESDLGKQDRILQGWSGEAIPYVGVFYQGKFRPQLGFEGYRDKQFLKQWFQIVTSTLKPTISPGVVPKPNGINL